MINALDKRRRALLRVLVALATTIGVPNSARSRQRQHPLHHPHLPLEGLITDRDSARFVGREYLTAFPAESSASWLADEVTRCAGLDATAPDLAAAVRDAVQARQKLEFDAGDIVILDGWVLSRTEARLCALYTLVGG